VARGGDVNEFQAGQLQMDFRGIWRQLGQCLAESFGRVHVRFTVQPQPGASGQG
jgi:hypothetical protein